MKVAESKGSRNLTLGTAAWKLSPVAVVVPDIWNHARIMMTLGQAADTTGVSLIFSSFLSYAVYDIRRGVASAADGGAGGWDWDWG